MNRPRGRDVHPRTDYTYLSARDTLRRTIAWLIDRGFVVERRRALLHPHPALQNAY